MIKGFQFDVDGRSYTCTAEARTGATNEFWWWFSVTGDAQRYAGFQAIESDTRPSVQERVVAFYTNRLFKLSQPTQRPTQWRKAPAAAAEPAPTE